MKRSSACLAAAMIASLGLTGAAFGQGDYYIRSQHSNGSFTGSHEILTSPKKGFYQARYCDRAFWVSSNTVIWTEEQTAEGRRLILEENLGAGRQVVCADNTAFATLDDLGLAPGEIERIRRDYGATDMKSSRLRTIRDAFKQFK
ncbi:MAG: hypothetical protein K5905_18630 [Roseibium sp.]|uniref:hypothetical protein n=1 Tax=Roseibium sp. TaxID=1936156 RepID=UPI002634431A|nr:hypothetical protein [Roseibium sp.]MCV0427479.1 hypothetical protein [Roseibium sp.]